MKRLVPLLIVCLSVLCFFSSCEGLEKLALVGTWKIDVNEGSSYSTYKIVFSEDQVQLIKTEYKDRWRRRVELTGATEPMPYTIGTDGVVTVSYTVGVMNEIDITDTLTLDADLKKLIWKQGFSEKEYSLDKESYSRTFSIPSGFEQYSCEHVWYWEAGEEIQVDNSNIFLYMDGTYSWNGDGRTVSSGSWTKNGNMITLKDSRGWIVSEMVFEFVEEPSKTPHLKLKKIVPDDNLDFTQIDYDFAWCVDRYR